MKITIETAKKFFEEIREGDSVAIISHKDLDGFASAMSYFDFCKKKGIEAKTFFMDYGVNDLKTFEKELKEVEIVLMADLAPGMFKGNSWEVLKGKQVFYTDHHPEEKEYPVPSFVWELRLTENGVPSSRTCFDVCGGKRWLSLMGLLADKGDLYRTNEEFIQESLKEINITREEANKFLFNLSDFVLYFEKDYDKAFEELKKLEKIEDINKLKKYWSVVEKEFQDKEKEFEKKKEEYNGIVYFYFESHFNLRSPLVTKLSSNDKSKIYIFASAKNESLVGMSARNQSREYDVNAVLKKCLEGFKDAFAGGHKVASGGQVDKKDLENFKERLKQIKLEDYRV